MNERNEKHPYRKKPEYEYEYEDEIELMDYINVLWKRKWLIIIPTFILVVLAGVYSFLQTPVWRVEALVQPSKFLIQTQSGQFEEVLATPPQQIASQINEGSYNQLIAAELNLDIRKFPKLDAETIKGTELVKVSTKNHDVEQAKNILFTLFKHLKRKQDAKVDIEMENIESQIKSKELNKKRIEEEINLLKNKLNIVRQRRTEIEEALRETRKRVELLEKEQNINLKKQNWNNSEALGMLLYSNEIQQSLQYLNNLNESLSQKRIEEENIKNRIEEKQSSIKQIENRINNLKEKKGRIEYTQLVKPPTSSLSPVAPNKKLNVAIAGVLGLFIFTLLAFFIEYIKKQKSRETSEK